MSHIFAKVKITVIKRILNEDVVNETQVCGSQVDRVCPRYYEGQEIIVDDPPEIPEGFCAWAWADMKMHIAAVSLGSKFGTLKNPNSLVAICSDPWQPVVFSIERILE